MKHPSRKLSFAIVLILIVAILVPVSALADTTAVTDDMTEGFDDISTLTASGWLTSNNSAPVGTTGWFQGNGYVFSAQSGDAAAYIGANFNNTGSTGTISNWLITPVITLNNGSTFSFYTRKAGPGEDFPDRLEVRLSTNGDSASVGATAESVGDFTTKLLTVNENLVAGGYPQTWTQYTVTISGLSEATNGRLAFRYYVTNAGAIGTNSDYIGIDTISYDSRAEINVSANDASFGSVSGGAVYDYGANATVTATANAGYSFVDWTDGDGTSVSTSAAYSFTVAEQLDLTANFKLDSGLVNVVIGPEAARTAGAAWSVDGGTTWFASGSQDIPVGNYTITFKDITGWDTPADIALGALNKNDVRNFNALYEVSEYTVTLPTDTGISVTTISGDPAAILYGNSYSFTATLDPEYTQSIITVKANGTVLTPDADGLYTIANITEDQTVTVEGIALNTYDIYYSLNGGTNESDAPAAYTYSVGAVLPDAPAKTGSTFAGWYDNPGCFGDPVTEVTVTDTGDMYFWAKWDVDIYRITYNLNGGLNLPTAQPVYVYGIGATLPTIVLRIGYTFEGWYDNEDLEGSPVTSIAPDETGNRTYWAKWSVNEYPIYYNLAGGTNPDSVPTSYIFGSSFDLPVPEREGYTFTGWYTNYLYLGWAKYSINPFDFGTQNLWASWRANIYTINYVMNDGTNPDDAPAAYVYGFGAILPVSPTRDGYTFSGWYESEDFSGSAVTEVTGVDTGDKTFYAKWNLIVDPDLDNLIVGILSGDKFIQNEDITFTAVGGGMDNSNPVPGDVRYVPAMWNSGKNGIWTGAPYSAKFTEATPGKYTLSVTFSKEVFENGIWSATGETVIKTVDYTVIAESDKPDTGDNFLAAAFAGIAVASAAAATYIIKKKNFSK